MWISWDAIYTWRGSSQVTSVQQSSWDATSLLEEKPLPASSFNNIHSNSAVSMTLYSRLKLLTGDFFSDLRSSRSLAKSMGLPIRSVTFCTTNLVLFTISNDVQKGTSVLQKRPIPAPLMRIFFFSSFFLCVPSYISGVHHFGWDFCVCDHLFNPTIKFVTFHLVNGVFCC